MASIAPNSAFFWNCIRFLSPWMTVSVTWLWLLSLMFPSTQLSVCRCLPQDWSFSVPEVTTLQEADVALASVISSLPHTQSQSAVTLAPTCTLTQANLHADIHAHTHTHISRHTMCIVILTHCTLINTCTDIFVSAHWNIFVSLTYAHTHSHAAIPHFSNTYSIFFHTTFLLLLTTLSLCLTSWHIICLPHKYLWLLRKVCLPIIDCKAPSQVSDNSGWLVFICWSM